MEQNRKTAILAGTGLAVVALGITLASLVLASCNNQKEKTIPIAITSETEVINDSSEETPVDTSEETTEETSEQEPEVVETTETTEEGTEETPEEPSEPDPEPETETEDPQVEEPETSEEETTEEEPEEEAPSIDPYTVYQFNVIKNLLITYPELNGSDATIRVRVAGQAFGTPGYCFFQDTEDTPITSSMEINNNMSNFLAREDCGNNNAYYTRGDIITISGIVVYEKVTYLGATCVTIK